MLDVRAQLAAGMAALTNAREQQMLDTCTATRPGAAGGELDPATGMPTGGADPTVYDGPCTLSDPTSAQITGRTVTDDAGVPSTRVLKVPHRADLRPGDLVTLTSSVLSPGLVNEVLVVLREEERSYATHRRYVVRGSSWPSPEAGT